MPERPGVHPLSVLVIAKDEEEMVGECLESCAFAGEIVVVDAGSSDATVEIARARGARVLEHPFETHARQKNWGLEQLAHDWVLVVDADERVSPDLANEITALLSRGPECPGYWIRRRNTFLGRIIQGAGWGRDRVLRFFDRHRARYDDRLVHETVILSGEAGTLRSVLLHHPCRTLDAWIRKTIRYANQGALDAHARGERPGWVKLALRPPARFVKQYVIQRGFLDGVEGFLLCVTSAFGVFWKYARLRELARRSR
jgi:glycosyltransferase involved in cell wall biosynthesis